MMRSLTSLMLLAFVAGTLVLAAQPNRGKQVQVESIEDDHGFDATKDECPHDEHKKCPYREACYCKPRRSYYIRRTGYFYSPKLGKCVKAEEYLDYGCNSFPRLGNCLDKCGRIRPGKNRIMKKKH
uniref:Putative secreted protein n=1 Tax=Amblyomma cajennense TaxID=34607 RepID=A0A023FDQ0_AMBCJ